MNESARDDIALPTSLFATALSASDFVQMSPVGLFLYDRQAEIVDCNDVAAEFFGYERSELIGRAGSTLWEVRLQNMDGSVFPLDQSPAQRTLRERRALRDVLIGADIAAKPLRWARVNTNLVQSGGEVQGVLETWVDCTPEIERNRILELGSELLRVVESTHAPSELLQGVCNILVESGRYRLAWIGTDLNDGRGTVEVSYSAGAVDYLYDGIVSSLVSEPNGIGPTGTALRIQEIQFANNLAMQQRYGFWRERVKRFDLWSAAAIPFHTNQSHVLTVYDRHPLAFDQAIIRGIVEMTNTVAQRVRLLETLEELRRSFQGTIAALEQIIEVRDPYTEGHQVRVGDLGAAIAQGLSLDVDTIATIRLAGRVHDVGKIAVPAEILTHPGRLSKIEFAMIKQHCEVGANILSKASLPSEIVKVALQHHERMDGSGYPLGLLGDQIGMPARIVAVADVVEAMAHHRPYRPALGLEVALAEIELGKGTLFDVDVVDACTAAFGAGFEFAGDLQPMTDQI